MRVMYVASNPEGSDTLLIDREISEMRDRLDRSANADPIDFSAYPNLAVGDLAEKMRRFRPDVLHVAAHGEDDALTLAHPVEGHVLLDGSKLAALLAAVAVKPKLIVLNACSSNGMAAALAAAGAADFVIGTDAPISNDGARAMAASLYQRLADGASVADAFAVASTNLDLVDGGEVAATLHPVGTMEAARLLRLVDPMRIVACFPVVEEWLGAHLTEPGKGFRPERPKVQFGVGGSPAAARQTVFFTDDETVNRPEGGSLEEARSWIVETQPWEGEIWMADAYEYYGDMSWYVAITTTDRRVLSTASTTVEALRRYYFDELWQGPLPPAIADVVRRSLACLAMHGGGRRGRRAASGARRDGLA